MFENLKKRNLVLILVMTAVALVQGRSLFLGFNSFWDQIHVFQNPFQSPLSLKLIGDAFRVIVEAEYAPLRMITNSFDYTFWGLNPFGHHLGSFLFFLIDVLLVFVVAGSLLRRAGIDPSRRLAVAALTAFFFGIHPLRVEVVAWITPREYLLGLSFYLAALGCYLKWADGRGRGWYAGAFISALGAGFCQPFSVSLPAALLVLDYYPLKRLRRGRLGKILAEKIPFLVIAVLVTAQIVRIRRQVGIIHPVDLTVILRNLAEFPAVIGAYLYKTFFPVILAPIYPLNQTASAGLMILSWATLTALIVLFATRAKKSPALAAGALFFLVTLIPNGGILRSGATVLADRYTLLATLPLYLGVAGLVIRGVRSSRFRFPVLVVTAVWSLFLIWKTVTYTGLWDDPVALTREAYRRWPDSRIIEIFMLRSHNQAALELISAKNPEEALVEVERALSIRSDYLDSHLVKAHALSRAGRDEEALAVYRNAMKFSGNHSNTFLNRGVLFARRGELDRAEAEFQRALFSGEKSSEVHYNLGIIYKLRGDPAQAEAQFRKALFLNRFSPAVYRQLAAVLDIQKKYGEVAVLYREAVNNNPDNAAYRTALGYACLRLGRLGEAEAAFGAALKLGDAGGDARKGLAEIERRRDRPVPLRLRPEVRKPDG